MNDRKKTYSKLSYVHYNVIIHAVMCSFKSVKQAYRLKMFHNKLVD